MDLGVRLGGIVFQMRFPIKVKTGGQIHNNSYHTAPASSLPFSPLNKQVTLWLDLFRTLNAQNVLDLVHGRPKKVSGKSALLFIIAPMLDKGVDAHDGDIHKIHNHVSSSPSAPRRKLIALSRRRILMHCW